MSKWHGGKGSTPRPVDRKKYESNWDAIFGKKEGTDLPSAVDDAATAMAEGASKQKEDPLDVYNDARLSTLQDEKAWADVPEQK